MRARIRNASLFAAAAALLVAAAWAGTARAGDELEDGCRQECGEARRVCNAAAKAAWHVCWDRCQDAVLDAVARANQICSDRQLGPRACAKLTSAAAEKARTSCHGECDRAERRARATCKDERRECRQACIPLPGRACAGGCLDDFAACRDQLDACTDGCGTALDQALDACRDLVADTCDPDAFKACVRDARTQAGECRDDCHDQLECADGLRECLWDCVEIDQTSGEPAEPTPAN